ncbi:ATP-binding cassette domain-containing protein [Schlesneria sp. DSM 10557]|uniref:ATP-binding cassette domain-containing protein n=1 Tax=Schlesneria sp. DSM 10557 TaxID=3044399 RepID=UPI0035A074CA
MLWSLETVSLSGRRSPRLDRISLAIPEGITAVLGHSGVGKTSLLNLLVGFETPSSGKVLFQADIPATELPLFWVPANHGLWPHLSARDHLLTVMPATQRDPTGRADELLARFDLTEQSDATPGLLSQGERSRLNVARGLASEAKVLVMDEPLAHVDSARCGCYWAAIREHCQGRGTSLVLATHLPDVVLREAQHVICLGKGVVTYAGDVMSLYHKPPTRELAELLGPCNWLASEDSQRWLNCEGPRQTEGETERSLHVSIRPERITVQPHDDSALIVERSRFAGASTEVDIRDERSGTVHPFVVRSQGSTDIQPGQRVVLQLLQVLLLLLFLPGCLFDTSPILPVKAESTWQMPPDGARVPAPRGMTVSPQDEYLVLDNAGRVLVFDGEGDLQRQWWMPEYAIGKAEGICVLKDGRIAVADTHYHRIVLFDHEGEVTGMFGQRGSEPGDFVYPVSITQDPDENLYVCEYGQNDRVQKFRPDGTFLLQFGGPGTGLGQFQRPSGIVWYDHHLYIVDAFNNRIQVYTDEGNPVAILADSDRIAEVHYPYDIAVDQKGDLLVVEYGAGRVSKFSRSGRLLGRYGRSGPGQQEAQFSTPWGISIDRRGRIYVCDTGNRRIVELDL